MNLDVSHQSAQSQLSVGFFDCLEPVHAESLLPDDTTTVDQRLNFPVTPLPTRLKGTRVRTLSPILAIRRFL